MKLRVAGWSRINEALCAASGAALAVALGWRHFGPWSRALTSKLPTTGRAWFAFACYVLVMCVALGGLAIAWGLWRATKRFRPAVVLGPLLLGAAAAAGAVRAGPIGAGAVLGSLALAIMWRRTGPSVAPRSEASTRVLIAGAAEAACFAMGVWFPYSESSPALVLVATGVAGVAAAVWLGRRETSAAWRVVGCALPFVALPLAGLLRSPTLRAPLDALLVAVALWVASRRFPRFERGLATWAEAHALEIALPAAAALLFVPFRFHDIPSADLNGHEAPHLGWINSILFGKLMLADAGFIYGPLREYTLTAIAAGLGGVTLEHVRIAHILVNLAGTVLLVAAISKVARGRTWIVLVGFVLVLLHTPIVTFMTYLNTYSLGWADELRAGLPCFAIVQAFAPNASRRRLFVAGVLLGASALYSQDFGPLAILATCAGMLSWRMAKDRAPFSEVRRATGWLLGGVTSVVGTFVAVYVVCGRGRLLAEGLVWMASVASGRAGFAFEPFPVTYKMFADAATLLGPFQVDAHLGSSPLDYLAAPAISLLGLGWVLLAMLRRRWTRRTGMILALSLFAAAVLRHPMLTVDPWHMTNATTPSLLLLAALLHDAATPALAARKRVLALAPAATLALVAFWLYHGRSLPLQTRLGRIASGEERPSFGPPHLHPDILRAGDVVIPDPVAPEVRYIQANTRPGDPVYCTTWLLGGGAEAFLSHRRNPTSVDVPHEVLSDRQRKHVLADLQANPPVLIVGTYFNELGDEVQRYIYAHWEPAPGAPAPMMRFKKDAP